MRKNILWVVCVATLAACNNGRTKVEESVTTVSERDSLLEVINQTNNELNEVMGTFNQIQDGFQRIAEAQGRVDLAKSSGERGTSVKQIQEDMALIAESMEQNNKLIAELKAKLRNGEVKSAELQQAIAKLNTQLEEKQAEIEKLRSELASKDIVIAEQGEHIQNLATNVSNLSADNSQKTAKLDIQDKQIHTAWFVFGTKSELKDQKILMDGEVLRSSEFNRDYFTKIDIRTMREIKLYSKSAKLLTDHPAGTYELGKDAKGQYVLRITYPQQFWSTNKYLVILVK